MSEQRPFGLASDPEVQGTRQRSFGTGNLGALLLALAAVSLLLHLDEFSSFSLDGRVLFLLALPVLMFGGVWWWSVRQRGQVSTVILMAYVVTQWLQQTAGVVSDLTLGRPVDRWDAGFSLVVGGLLPGLLVWLFIHRLSGRSR